MFLQPARPTPATQRTAGAARGKDAPAGDAALPPVRRIVRQQRLGRRILRVDGIRIALDSRGDLHRELLAELHAPLVEGVDAPDRALRERDVLVERDQLTEYL